MNDIVGDRVGPMPNPPHLGELIRESMDDVGWNVTETAARLRERNAVAPAERQGGRVREHGAGAGGHRLGHRRSLDADAGELRTCAGAPGPDCRRPAHGQMVRMMSSLSGRLLGVTDPAKLGDVQHRLESYRRFYVAAMQLTLLVGCRPHETCRWRWWRGQAGSPRSD